MSKCGRAVEQMTDEYSQYTQSQHRDHDELRRRIDVVNDHWSWLKRIVNKYENQHKPISSQTDKFDNGKNSISLIAMSQNAVVMVF